MTVSRLIGRDYCRCLCLVAGWFLSLCVATSAVAQQGATEARPASVATAEGCPPRPPVGAGETWSAQELWIWRLVCSGEIADLSLFSTPQPSSTSEAACDPQAQEAPWPKTRVIRPQFLQVLLLHGPRRRVHLSCATFEQPLDLSDISISARLRIEESRFNEDVDISALRSSSSISFIGSRFDKGLTAYHADLQGGLFLGEATIAGELDLSGARVGQDIDLSGAQLSGRIAGGGLTVGSSLLLEATQGKDVFLSGAAIGGDLLMDYAVFDGTLKADRLTVGGSIFMRAGASFQTVDLLAAQIGQHLALFGGVYGDRLDLSGARINGELRLSGPTTEVAGPGEPRWMPAARLILRNTQATALNATRNSWDLQQGDLDLIGFTYGGLGGIDTQPGHTLADEPPEWLIDGWLQKQEGIDTAHTPQPFQELARVLRTTGHIESADAIMIAEREQQLNTTTSWLTWIRLQLLRLLIGYGYRNWQAGIWFGLLVVAGVIQLIRDPIETRMGFWQRFWFSVDLATPILELDKDHADVRLSEPGRVYFYFHQVMGYVLVGFLLAGLSGLTR